jgi:AcrR family transcriptional regulator
MVARPHADNWLIERSALRSRRSSRKMSASQRKPVLDPRIERSRQVILQAVLEELSESGYGALTIESATRRAGVGKSSNG